jgi:hypothetical protein
MDIIWCYIYICSLFVDAGSSSDYTASNVSMIKSNELERMCLILKHCVPGGTDENHEKLQ